MAELETAAWKDDRRFRLLSLDGGVLTFSDLLFHTPSRPLAAAAGGPEQAEGEGNISITGQ